MSATPLSPQHNVAEDYDDDWDERRTPAQWLFDVALLPGLIVLLTTTVFLVSSVALWGTFLVWSRIAAMINY